MNRDYQVYVVHLGSQDHKDLQDQQDGQDLKAYEASQAHQVQLDPQEPAGEVWSTSGGGRAPVLVRQGLNWCMMEEQQEPNTPQMGLELIISACHQIHSTPYPSTVDIREM